MVTQHCIKNPHDLKMWNRSIFFSEVGRHMRGKKYNNCQNPLIIVLVIKCSDFSDMFILAQCRWHEMRELWFTASGSISDCFEHCQNNRLYCLKWEKLKREKCHSLCHFLFSFKFGEEKITPVPLKPLLSFCVLFSFIQVIFQDHKHAHRHTHTPLEQSWD